MTTIDSYRLKRQDDGRIALEFGSFASPPTAGVQPDFVAQHRIELTDQAAWRLVDGIALALGRPLSSAPPMPPASSAAPQARAAAGGQPRGDGPASAAAGAARPPPAFARAGAQVLDLGADAALRQRGTTPVNLPPDPMAETANWLMEAVRAMAPEHYHERSFRIAPSSLQGNRFLLSIGSRQMPPEALDKAWAIASHLGLPASTRPAVESAFAAADHLHFGFEGEPGRMICKIYFERTVTGLEAARARESGEPALQYEAFKWNVATGEHVVTRYRWHAGLSVAGIGSRLDALCADAGPSVAAMARDVLDAAASRLPPERLIYLEVDEPGQARKSFDLNVYDAELHVRDLQPVLFRMRDHFGVRPGQFQALYDQVKSRRLGHVAGGTHRNAEAFFNVYYGGTRHIQR